MAILDLFKRKKQSEKKEDAKNPKVEPKATTDETKAAEPKPQKTNKVKDDSPAHAEENAPKVKSAPKSSKAPAEVKEEPKVTAKAKDNATTKAETKTAPKVKNTPEPIVEEPQAAPEAEVETPAGEITGRFEINKSKDGKKFFFNLFASNKVGIATSQMYSSAQSALNGIKSVIANADKAPIEDQSLKNYETLPFPKWEIYIDNGGKYRFRLNASNGNCVCHSQGYTTKASCKNGIDSIIRSSRNAEIDKTYITKKDEE